MKDTAGKALTPHTLKHTGTSEQTELAALAHPSSLSEAKLLALSSANGTIKNIDEGQFGTFTYTFCCHGVICFLFV
jgi:hypothetical protein